MRVVVAIPAVALIAGSAIGLVFPDTPTFIPLVTLVAACATAVACRHDDRLVLASVVVGFAAGGEALASHAWQEARASPLRRFFDDAKSPTVFTTVEGVMRADASPGDGSVSLTLDVDRPAAGGVIISVGGTLSAPLLTQWRAGRRIRAPVLLRRPTRYFDVDVPDGERALQLRGISLVGSTKSGALVDVVAPGSWLSERFADVRAFSRSAIQDGVGRWSSRSAAIVTAIVIGDRAGLTEQVQQALQQAGTYHVIAISGGNIAILAGLLLALFRWAGSLGRAACLAAICVLISYAAVVGGGASVNRATLMAVVYFAARAADQRSPPFNTLALAAAVLVAFQPFSVVDPAFVLTFGATLAILIVAPLMARVPSRWRAPVSLVIASAAAETLLFPAGAMFFSRVTFAGLALNLLAIPLMAVAQIAGMVLVPVASMSTKAAAIAGLIAHAGAEGLVRSAELVRFAPFLTFRLAPPSWWVVVVYYLALIGLWLSRNKRFVSAISVISVLTAFLCALWILCEPWSWLSSRGDGRLHLSFLDVGQGDSAFIRLPHGSTLLVDTGGSAGTTTFDIGDRVVAPVLRHAGVRRLDYLVLTHGDPDHIGGAAAIVDEFRPRHIWEGTPVPRFEPMQALHAMADARGLAWKAVLAGERVHLDGVDIDVLHPPPPDWERQKVRNDDSIVIDLRWRDVSVVLTGDIGKAVERQLIPALTPAPLRIVKVPHHGSLTSSSPEFIAALHPSVAVFSAGRNNRFGHPVPEVVERYRAAGAEVVRTDRDGELDITTDGSADGSANLKVCGYTWDRGRQAPAGGWTDLCRGGETESADR